jgi:hypothetical protein
VHDLGRVVQEPRKRARAAQQQRRHARRRPLHVVAFGIGVLYTPGPPYSIEFLVIGGQSVEEPSAGRKAAPMTLGASRSLC